MLHRIFGHRAAWWADFTDTALTPPLELVRAGDDVAIRDASGRVLTPPRDGTPCSADTPDAQTPRANSSETTRESSE